MVCLLLLAPLVLVDVPPLLDYPNHLARAFVLAFGGQDPVLSEFYRAHWSILPNLATDLLLTPLLRALPDGVQWVHLAGRVVVGIFLLLPVLGTTAYSWAVFERSCWWPLASALVAYNSAFLQGFLNFIASAGLALLCAAMWRRWRQPFPARTIAAGTIATAVLFFCHLMGLGFFLLLIAAGEIEAAWDESYASASTLFPAAIARRTLVSLPMLVPPALLYTASEFGQAAGEPQWRSLAEKFTHLLDPVINYNLKFDELTASAVIGFLVLTSVVSHLRVPVASAIVLTTLLALYLVAPFDFKGTAALDMRFIILAAFMLFASVLPCLSDRADGLAAASFAALLLIRMAIVGVAWFDRGRDLAQFRQTIAQVPSGSRVYWISAGPVDAPNFWGRNSHGLLSDGTRTDYHLAALLVIEQRSFWPYLFAYASQQPVGLTPRYAALAEQTTSLPDAEFVAACRSAIVPTQLDTAVCGYDYLIVLEAAALPDPGRCAPHRLSLIAATNMAALFRVKVDLCKTMSAITAPTAAVAHLSE